MILNRKRGNSFKLCQEGFGFCIRKKFLETVVRPSNRLSRKLVESLSLEVLKNCGDVDIVGDGLMVGLGDLVVLFYLCGSVILISADRIWCRAKVERTCFSIKKHNIKLCKQSPGGL